MGLRLVGHMAVVVILGSASIAVGDDLDLKWSGACRQVEGFVNVLFDATRTTCIPAGYAAKNGTLMLFADKPVLSVPAAKKAWLFSVVGSVGLVMNDALSLRCVNVVLVDSEGMQARRGYSLPCPFVKRTQLDIKVGTLTIEDAWARIEKALKPINVQKPKT